MKKYKLYHDNELLHLLSRDDDKAFTEIYHRHWKMVYAIGLGRLKNTQAAEDLLHDVFTSLWHNRHKAAIKSLQNYLASASKYLVFASIRRSMHEQRYQASRREELTVSHAENDLLYKQLYEFVNEEIDTLPEKCRLIFKYSREKGMSNKEIATELAITTKTVENQINKALNLLRFSMKKILLLLAVNNFFISIGVTAA